MEAEVAAGLRSRVVVPARRTLMEPVERFAHNLREARLHAGLSQEALALAASLHRTEISLLERGAREPRLSTLIRLSRALKVPAATLLAGIK